MPTQGRKLSMKSKFKNKFSQGKMKAGQAYQFTSKRKAALMKAVKASAMKRKQQAKAAGTSLKAKARGLSLQARGSASKLGSKIKRKATLRVRGAAMKARSAYKRNKATKGSVVQKAIVARNKARNKVNAIKRKATNKVKAATGYISAPKGASKLRKRKNFSNNVKRIASNTATKLKGKASAVASRLKGKAQTKAKTVAKTAKNKASFAAARARIRAPQLVKKAKSRATAAVSSSRTAASKAVKTTKTRVNALRGAIKAPRYDGPAGGKPKASVVQKAKASIKKATQGTTGLGSGPNRRYSRTTQNPRKRKTSRRTGRK